MIKKKVVSDRSPALAVSSLLELPRVKVFADSLADSDRPLLSHHLRLYTDIYLPGCPFQISTTARYGAEEAAVIARTDINTGEILFLRGVLANFEEDFVPDWSQWDFSIMESSRYGDCSLMEGPLRFVNHDCYPNCRFESSATSEVKAIAIRRILVGEEITARYKANMFGSGCLCETCVPQDPRSPSKPYNFRTRHTDMVLTYRTMLSPIVIVTLNCTRIHGPKPNRNLQYVVWGSLFGRKFMAREENDWT